MTGPAQLDNIRQRFPWLAWQVDAAVAKVPSLRMETIKRSGDKGASSPRRAAGW